MTSDELKKKKDEIDGILVDFSREIESLNCKQIEILNNFIKTAELKKIQNIRDQIVGIQ